MKPEFLNLPISAVNLMNGKWRLLSHLGYIDKSGYLWMVNAGFETDWGSVPAVVDWIIPKNSTEADPAYVLHDDLYQKHREGATFSRKFADDLLLEGLEVCGIGAVKRYTIYYAVRSWGWIAWNRRA